MKNGENSVVRTWRKTGGLDSFSAAHPLVNLVWFLSVMGYTMFITHPVFLVVALFAAFSYSMMLTGGRALKFNLKFLLPLLIFTAVFNPLFNHQGITILFYFDDGNPCTLESLVWGVAAAVMFIAVILWFSCYNAVMTSDKFIYLFGRIIPSLSLVLSMILRFVPRYIAQIKIISHSQKCIGRSVSNSRLLQKVKNAFGIVSIMTTWALENAVETADSMKSRGHGLKGRTSFSNFRFTNRDKLLITVIALLNLAVCAGLYFGQVANQYFVEFTYTAVTFENFYAYLAFLLLCTLPIILNILEEMNWKLLELKT